MALGRKIITWEADEILKGVSTSDDTNDGGFSPVTDQVNLIYQTGIMYTPAGPTDSSTNATGDMIASCEDQSGSYTRLFVSADSSQDGQFYSMDGTGALTARGSEDTTNNYIAGRTDFIGYQGEAYATSAATIIRWSGIGGANTFNTSFFSFNDSIAPHPALVFEDNAFFGDGNLLKRMTSAGSAPATILTLPTGQIITALGIDPGSGKMLIGTVNQYNVSNTINSQARVSFYDGFSNKVIRVVLMDDMVTAFPTTEGQQYIQYGLNLGYWNGSGATFIRKLDLTFDNNNLAYKHHFTSIGPTLYVIQGRQVLAHGPLLMNGPKVFYPVHYNYINTNKLTNIAYVGTLASTTQQSMSLAFSTSKFYIQNLSSIDYGVQALRSNKYSFPEANDGMWIRRVLVFWKNQVTNNIDPGSLRFYNEEGAVVSTIGQSGLYDLRNTTGAATAFLEIFIGGGTGTRFREFQFELILDIPNAGIQRIEVYGDPANQP